jgi:putative oxidoreductase
MKDFLFGGARLSVVSGDVGLLVLRVFAGLSVALAHGFDKLPPPAGFMQAVEALGMPAQAAWLSGVAEGLGGMALAVGLLTRPAALMLAVNFAVASFMQHAPDPYTVKELALLFLAVSLMFACVGAGRFSLDRIIRK